MEPGYGRPMSMYRMFPALRLLALMSGLARDTGPIGIRAGFAGLLTMIISAGCLLLPGKPITVIASGVQGQL